METLIENVIENLINGNLTTAKQQARQFESWEIRDAMIDDYGWTLKKTVLACDWLKGRDCWQAYCDAD